MFKSRKFLWLVVVVVVVAVIWRWRQQRAGEQGLNGRDSATTFGSSTAATTPSQGANAARSGTSSATSRRIVTRVHKGVPPPANASKPADQPQTGEPAVEAPQAPEAPASTEVQPVNINAATIDALVELPGIGPVLAQRIVEYREANGPFSSVEGLGVVQGISAALVSELTPYVQV